MESRVSFPNDLSRLRDNRLLILINYVEPLRLKQAVEYFLKRSR